MLVRHRLEQQYADLEQQHQAAALGMWVFLATEVMFFGTLFLAVGVYRFLYAAEFEAASRRLNWVIGGVNTLVLLVEQLDDRIGRPSCPTRPPPLCRALSRADRPAGLVFSGLQGARILHGLPGQPDSRLEIQSAGVGHAGRAATRPGAARQVVPVLLLGDDRDARPAHDDRDRAPCL